MIRTRKGEVIEILEVGTDITEVKVLVEGEEVRAIHYANLSGPLHLGQRVILNTTAHHLKLGTGGYHFIIYAEGNDELDVPEAGHIMKLRYTPYQVKVLSVEEEASPHHSILVEKSSLEGLPVVVAPLHSMIMPVIAAAKASNPQARIAYLMSDGAAIPLAFSNLVRDLRQRNWLAGTITFGHAFGGDYEAVNVYTALLTAKWVLKADLAVIAMGPGIVGTGTPLGFSGVEQADFLHAVSILQGVPIAIPRISFADSRERHQGISHHSITILSKLTLIRCKIGIPRFSPEKLIIIMNQLHATGIREKHHLIFQSVEQLSQLFKEEDLLLQTMSRGYADDEEFFLTAGLAGIIAVSEVAKAKEQNNMSENRLEIERVR